MSSLPRPCLLLPALLWGCRGDKTVGAGTGETGGGDGGTPGDSGASGDSGAVTWTTLPATCAAPADLQADPLTLEGEVRVTQDGGGGFMEALDVDLEGDIAWVVGMGFPQPWPMYGTEGPAAPHTEGPWETS